MIVPVTGALTACVPFASVSVISAAMLPGCGSAMVAVTTCLAPGCSSPDAGCSHIGVSPCTVADHWPDAVPVLQMLNCFVAWAPAAMLPKSIVSIISSLAA